MRNGWIKLHRSLLDWEWYKDLPTRTLFIHLLLIANYEPNKYKGVNIEVGELTTSVKSLSQDTGLSIQQVKTALKKLEKSRKFNNQNNKQIYFDKH